LRAETEEQRSRRLAAGRERAARYRANETPAQRTERLAYFREYKKSYYPANKEKISAGGKRRYEQKRSEILIQCREYRHKNKDKLAAACLHKRRTAPQTLLASRLRHRLFMLLRVTGTRKTKATMRLVGCDRPCLKTWVEMQFLPGMTWGESREWHIDHIIPCSAFDLTSESQQSVAFHYLNLRPMWAKDNVAKRDRLVVDRPSDGIWTLDHVMKARRITAGVRR
jgi:hypothetical protein